MAYNSAVYVVASDLSLKICLLFPMIKAYPTPYSLFDPSVNTCIETKWQAIMCSSYKIFELFLSHAFSLSINSFSNKISEGNSQDGSIEILNGSTSVCIVSAHSPSIILSVKILGVKLFLFLFGNVELYTGEFGSCLILK